MLIHDSLSGKKKELGKNKKPIKLFVCGPTVYDDSHLGHARTQIVFDIIVRYLRARGWKITYLQNITDVDDKIIARAKQENTHPLELAKKFEKRYREDLKVLGVNQIDTLARASDFIPQITKQVQTLVKKGYAYTIEGEGIYFDIKKFKNYGKLARRSVEQAEDGVSRIDEADKKRNKGDFCLWKFVPIPTGYTLMASGPTLVNGEPAWKNRFGWGRPGWHIEDTAITEHFFGPQYDIHGGGLDLKFPHHEAEIAQQEAASGKTPFVKIWMHAGLLRVNDQKMSKSTGNFITIREFLKENDAPSLRWLVLSHHYRSPANYSQELLKNAKESIRSIRDFLEKLAFVEKNQKKAKIKNFGDQIKKAEKEFHAAMETDLNTPLALAALFTLMREANANMWLLSKKDARAASRFAQQTLASLGFAIKSRKTPKNVENLARARELSRGSKHFIQADALRKKIEGLGYMVEDTPIGPLILKK